MIPGYGKGAIAAQVLKLFFLAVYLVFPLFLLLGALAIIVGQIVGRIEDRSRFDALYWSLITATTVGYGDFRPLQKRSKILSVVIAMLGIMITGIIVAITIETSSISFAEHIDVKAYLGD